MQELEDELFEVTQLIRKGVTHEEKLNVLTLESVIDLMGRGFPLSTRPKAKDSGILNVIRVPEHKFYAWLLKQPNAQQDNFNTVAIIQKNRRKEDLIEIIQETAEEFDDLIKSYQDSSEYEHSGEANMLDKKAKACSTLLKQLVDIEKSDKDTLKEHQPQGSDVHIHVHTDEAKINRLKQLRDTNK